MDKDVCGEDYTDVYADLNEDSDETTPTLKLCITKKMKESVHIDFAFVYKGRALYLFSGDDYYKMSKIPVQSSLKVIDGFPKKVSENWFKSSKCGNYEDKETCNQDISCFYNDKCSEKNYNAAFTYKFNKKTYFFRGGDVFLYDDSKKRIAEGYPKKIDKVFKGTSDNIDAVFGVKIIKLTFLKDLFNKYNDKQKKARPDIQKEPSLDGRYAFCN